MQSANEQDDGNMIGARLCLFSFWQIRLLFWNLPTTCVIIGAHSYESDTSLVLWYYLIMSIIKHLSVVIAIGFNVLVEWISHQSHLSWSIGLDLRAAICCTNPEKLSLDSQLTVWEGKSFTPDIEHA